jgi:Sulfotransferase family
MTGSVDTATAPLWQRQRRLPDFFIVGHPKGGTTALYEMLRRHPQIYMPDLKEPWFFVPEFWPSAPLSRRHPNTLDEYLSLFEAATPGQRIGEATPSYLRSHTAATRIAEVQPAARIIAILREPASFLCSLHLQLLRTDVETEPDLRKAIDLEERRRRGDALPRYSTRPQALRYSEHLEYVEQLRRYHAVFPPEQVRVIIYDDFRRDPEATVRTILRFLEVDDTAPLAVIEANPAVRLRSPHLSEVVRSLYLGRGPVARPVKAAIKALTPRRLRHDAIAIQRRMQLSKPRPPDEELMLELRRRFKGEVIALSEYLDRDLVSLWGYDGVD